MNLPCFYHPLLTSLVMLSFPALVHASGCCGGTGGGASGALALGHMMGPLNQPFTLTGFNTSGATTTVTLGGVQGRVLPGRNSVTFWEPGSFAPQPGEMLNLVTTGTTVGFLCSTDPKPKCPEPSPPAGSGGSAESANQASPQANCSASTEDNLDNDEPKDAQVLGSGGISPSPMDSFGYGNSLREAKINFSATLGETHDTTTGLIGSAGTILPDTSSTFEPHQMGLYITRATNPSRVVESGSNPRTFTVNSSEGPPSAVVLTQIGLDSLRFQFFSDAAATTLVKSTTITKSSQTAPPGYAKGWTFTVDYPVSHTVQTWITDSSAGNTQKTRVITGVFDREWESSLSTFTSLQK